MTASGFRVRITSLVFVFNSASLALKQVPTSIRKPKTNTTDKSIKFLHWLLLVVLDSFRSFQMVFGCFRSFLGRFRSFQVALARFSSFLTLVSTTDNWSLYPLKSFFFFLESSLQNFLVPTANFLIIPGPLFCLNFSPQSWCQQFPHGAENSHLLNMIFNCCSFLTLM